MAGRPLHIWQELRNTPESINCLDSPGTLSRKSREELFLLKQEFNPPGIMQARQVHIVYAPLTMMLPREMSQQEQVLHHAREHTQISPLPQSHHLPRAPCCAPWGRRTDVLTTHTPGDRLHLTVTSEDSCVLELSLAEASPRSHADAALLILNRQVGKYRMSTVLAHLIPHEFNTVRGAALIKKKYGYGSNCQCIDRRNKFRESWTYFLLSPHSIYTRHVASWIKQV